MAIQRLRQGIRALFAFTQLVDFDLAASYLTSAEMALFRHMRRTEQLHSLNVLRTVVAESAAARESVPAELAVAALLHDVGKSRYPLAVWQKTLAVLVRAFVPAAFQRLSLGDPRRIFQRPFVVYVKHPSWSAEMLAQTDALPEAIWLVAHHADDADSQPVSDLVPLLKRLQSADDAN
jgi:hypothetical protein